MTTNKCSFMVENSHFNNEKIKQEYWHKVEKFWFYMIEKKTFFTQFTLHLYYYHTYCTDHNTLIKVAWNVYTLHILATNYTVIRRL